MRHLLTPHPQLHRSLLRALLAVQPRTASLEDMVNSCQVAYPRSYKYRNCKHRAIVCRICTRMCSQGIVPVRRLLAVQVSPEARQTVLRGVLTVYNAAKIPSSSCRQSWRLNLSVPQSQTHTPVRCAQHSGAASSRFSDLVHGMASQVS